MVCKGDTVTVPPTPEDRKRVIAGVFDRAAPTYDQVGVDFFQVIGMQVVRRSDPKPGERVLDLGCGRGASALPAARAVGLSGRVVALDLAPKMVAAVNDQARDAGLTQLEAHVGDAERPDVTPGMWDVIQASLVLFFLPDLPAAMRGYRSLLSERGRLVFTSFGPPDETWETAREALVELLPEDKRPPRDIGRSGPFATPESIATFVTEAGFTNVSTEIGYVTTTYRDADQLWQWFWSAGLRSILENLEEHGLIDQTRERIEALVARRLAEYGSLEQITEIRYTTARP